MLNPLARFAAVAVVVGLLIPSTLFAQSIASSTSLKSNLAVRCFDGDPNLPNAEGLLALDPRENRITLLLDFHEGNSPIPPPLPGEEPAPINNGFFDMQCDGFFGPFNVSSHFAGALAAYGWDFETDFINAFPPTGPVGNLDSCLNPRVNALTFERQGFSFTCFAGLLLSTTNGIQP